jgi:hypothetical protein
LWDLVRLWWWVHMCSMGTKASKQTLECNDQEGWDL